MTAFSVAELRRLRGELLLAESRDQADAAVDCRRGAITTARRQRSRAWELGVTTSLARLWPQQGRREQARNALAAVYNIDRSGITTPEVVDAAALPEA